MRSKMLKVVICASLTLTATCISGQEKNPTDDQSTEVFSVIPFIGCPADGQLGPLDAPKGGPVRVAIPPASASRLGFYKAERGWGVIAPRGWNCFETYGSNGSSLFVSPDTLNPQQFFSDKWKGFDGPVIQLSGSYGDTSGRFEVASIMARVFPAHVAFVQKVRREEIVSNFPVGPYPADELHYQGTDLVEYRTPPNASGLGTESRLNKDAYAIEGVEILVGPTPDLISLAARMTPETRDLSAWITRDVERRARKMKRKPLD